METGLDNEEFFEMLDTCQSTLLRICMTYAGGRGGVGDLYQEVVYQLVKGYPRFRGESGVTTWAYRTALNTARRYRRWHIHQPATEPLDERLSELLAEEACDPLVERMHELTERLRDDERQLVVLYLDGFPLHEIADILSLPEATVRQRLHRITIKLKKLYEKEN